LPFVGALAGARMQNCSNVRAGDFCGLDGAESGLLLGGIAAVLLDASALAYEPQKPSKQSGRRLLVGPMIGDGHRGLSLAGTF
jgi:hypothetical protein